jgi:hypothetical protein
MIVHPINRRHCSSVVMALLTVGLFVLGGSCAAGASAHTHAQAIAADIEEAYVYALPVFEIARVRYSSTLARSADKSALNQLRHRRNLTTAENRTVTTPNNDTLYSQAMLDLRDSAVEITTPDFGNRYFSVAFMDVFSNNFAVIGRRTTGTRPQHYLVAGPRWQGTVPPGATMIRAPGDWVWVLVRILIQGPEELSEVRALQDGIGLRAIKEVSAGPLIEPKTDDAANFIAVVNEALRHNPPPRSDRAELARIGRVGIGANEKAPTDALLAAWQAQFPELRKRLLATFATLQPPTIHEGWNYRTADLGNFGTNYRFRAVVAVVGLAALEPAEAMYTNAVGDRNGDPLQSDRHYRWHIPSGGLPVDAFWSLTAYEEEPNGTLYFAENPIHRYAIGDRTQGLVSNPDGSLDILIQQDPPQGSLAANWLPIPQGPVRIILRAYQPRAELLDGHYRFPGLEPVP